MNVVVYGHTGCGKTRNADKICSHFNVDGHIDADDVKLLDGLDNHVIFTNDQTKLYDFTYDQLAQVILGLKD